MNNTKLTRILTAVSALIGLVGFIFLVMIINYGDEALTNDLSAQESVVSPLITFSTWILYLTIAVTIVFSVINLAKNPDQLKKALISVGVLGVILIAVYAGAPDNIPLDVNNQPIPFESADGSILTGDEALSASKWVSTGINYAIVLGGVGLAFFLWDFVKGLIK